jgi:hypothetical protein
MTDQYPNETEYAGIDYGLGRSNIDTKTGIRFGVISQHSISGDALNEMEPDYGNPTCPKCGDDMVDVTYAPDDAAQYEGGCADHYCNNCNHLIDSSDAYGEEAASFNYNGEGYNLQQGSGGGDIWVLASSFYTFAQYCSPCAPGAGDLDHYCKTGPKTYCLGHDWFEGGKAPYPVFTVNLNVEVLP